MVTKEVIADLLEAGYGKPLQQKYPRADFYYCLNQADTLKMREVAEEIVATTGRKGIVLSMLGEENILYGNREDSFSFPEEKRGDAEKTFRIAMIYMASGFGRRYGSNKLLEIVDEKPLYLHGLQTLREALKRLMAEQEPADENQEPADGNQKPADRKQVKVRIDMEIIVVSQYEEILAAARKIGFLAVHNPDSQEGITASIHLGIRQTPEADAYLFAVADQPWLKPESIFRLVTEYCASERSIACLADGEHRGNPVIFSKKYKGELLGLTGDRGGSVILKKHPQEVLEVPVEAQELRDVDIPLSCGKNN